jgi:hypothetical protein
MTTIQKFGNADNITVLTTDVSDITFILGNGQDDAVGLLRVGGNTTITLGNGDGDQVSLTFAGSGQ